MAEEDSAYSLPVDKFITGVDHFESWVCLFDAAIEIIYKGSTAADKIAAARQWLPLKLDDQARLVYSNVTGNTWAELKENLRKALIDPQEEYNWHAGKATIIWDGIESFQSLATRVKRAVNTHHRSNRETEYYFRFLLALPSEYKREINLGLSKGERKIENAVDIAERVRISNSETTGGPAPTTTPIPTSFTGAAMSGDRLHRLELAMEGMALRLGNIESLLKELLDDRRSRRGSDSRRESRQNSRQNSRDRHHRNERSDDYEEGGRRHDDNSPHRGHHDDHRDRRHSSNQREDDRHYDNEDTVRYNDDNRHNGGRDDWGRKEDWDRDLRDN